MPTPAKPLPVDPANAKAFVAYLETLGTPAEQQSAIDDHWSELGSDVKAAVRQWRVATGLPDRLQKSVDASTDVQAAKVKAGLETPAMQAAADKAQEDASTAALASGGTASDATTAAAQVAAKAAFDKIGNITKAIPKWAADKYFSGRLPTDQQSAALMREYNSLHPGANINPSMATPAGDTYLDVLWDKLALPTPDNDALVAGAALGNDPIVQHSFALGGGQNAIVSGEGLKLASTLGLGNGVLATVVRSANSAGLVDSSGQPLWQPVAALMKATRPADGSPGTGVWASNVTMPLDGTAPPPYGGQFPGLQGFAPPGTTLGAPATAGPINRDHAGPTQVAGNATVANKLAILYSQGLQQFGGDANLAFIYANDPQLAGRMASAKLGGITFADQQAAQRLFVKGGWDPATLSAAGYTVSTTWFDHIMKDNPDAFGGLGDKLRKTYNAGINGVNRFDPATIKQEVVNLWQRLFEQDPTPAQIAGISAKIEASLKAGISTDTNPDSQRTDLSAQALASAQASPQYAQMYGNKPAGMTDDTYHGQFQAAASSMLGSEAADPQAVRSGMSTGDYQTTIGQIAGSAQAQNNSTFLGRLAMAAQTMGKYT